MIVRTIAWSLGVVVPGLVTACVIAGARTAKRAVLGLFGLLFPRSGVSSGGRRSHRIAELTCANWVVPHTRAEIEYPRVLYVDTFAEADARMNTEGMLKAYRRRAQVLAFDYRSTYRRFGKRFMNASLVRQATDFRPDLIHIGKGEGVWGRAVAEIKSRIDTHVVHFYGDFRERVVAHVVEIGREADETLFYHKERVLLEPYRQAGVRNIGFWWVGTDPEVFYPRKGPKQYDIVFMANNADFLEGHGQRRDLIKAMADRGIDIHLFGRGWEMFAGDQHIHLNSFVDQEGFALACSRAKITLGYNAVNNVYMYASWRRPLNSMACGTMHMTRYFPGLEEVFQNGKHLVWFESVEEAVAQAERYLDDDVARERIGAAGRAEVLAKHTWDHRIDEMIRKIPAARVSAAKDGAVS